jgi:hypothetical protein
MRFGSSLVACVVAGALAGCATAPVPHPVLAEAAPAAAVAPQSAAAQPSPGDAQKEQKREEQTSDRASRRTNRTLGWIAVAVGAEALVAALVTSAVMLHENDVRNSNCSNKVCTPLGLDANTQLQQLGPWNTAAYIVGAVGLGAGAFLLLTNPAEKEGRTEVGVAPGGLTLRGSF